MTAPGGLASALRGSTCRSITGIVAAVSVSCGGSTASQRGAPPAAVSTVAAAQLLIAIQRPERPSGATQEPTLTQLEAEFGRLALPGASEAGRSPFSSVVFSDVTRVEISATNGVLTSRVRKRFGTVDLAVGGALSRGHEGDLVSMASDVFEVPVAAEMPHELVSQALRRAFVAASTRGATRRPPLAETGKPIEHLQRMADDPFDEVAWQHQLVALSTPFSSDDVRMTLRVVDARSYFVDSVGSRVQKQWANVVLTISLSRSSPAGGRVAHSRSIDAQGTSGLPDARRIHGLLEELSAELDELALAPLAATAVAPVLLEGAAAAGLFHEALGHQIEERHAPVVATFANRIGKKVLPSFVNVYDDPTISAIDGVPLHGHYQVDDEGVPARRVDIVVNGSLRRLLSSRSSAPQASDLDGHGRAEPGRAPVGRQANLVVHPEQVRSRRELRRQFIALLRDQQAPFGYRFVSIEGGTTSPADTDFQLVGELVYKVYPDGREVLVRDAVLEGDAEEVLQSVVAMGDRMGVYNGFCGAESGWVPVASAAPSVVLRKALVRAVGSSNIVPPPPPPPQGHAPSDSQRR